MNDWQNQDKKDRNEHDDIEELEALASAQNSSEIQEQDHAVDRTNVDRAAEISLFLRQLRQRHRMLQQDNRRLKRVLLLIDPQLDFHLYDDRKGNFYKGSLVSSINSH